VNAYFIKKNIGTWAVDTSASGEIKYDTFLEASPFILMGYKVGFQVGSVVLFLDNQFTYEIDETAATLFPTLKLVKRQNIEAVMSF